MGASLYSILVICFQACSNSAYPQHSGEQYRGIGPLVLFVFDFLIPYILVVICWEIAVLLAFRFCCFIRDAVLGASCFPLLFAVLGGIMVEFVLHTFPEHCFLSILNALPKKKTYEK